MKIQATSIALNDGAYLITGDSGVGKSSLALALINRGAKLISDDVTEIIRNHAFAPKKYKGCLEVRGIGIVSGLEVCEHAPVKAVVHLVTQKPERTPDKTSTQIPEFQIWTQDKNQADKVLLISKVIDGSVNIV